MCGKNCASLLRRTEDITIVHFINLQHFPKLVKYDLNFSGSTNKLIFAVILRH